MEDQRGTEINFELPDFLKANTTNKWKNVNKMSSDATNSKDINDTEVHRKGKAPQPAPRRSINRLNTVDNSSFSEATNENGDKRHGTYSSYSQGSIFFPSAL